MPVPVVKSVHTPMKIVPGTPVRFHLNTTNVLVNATITLDYCGSSLTWSPPTFSIVDRLLVVESLPEKVLPPGRVGDSGGSGTVTIIITNPPDAPFGTPVEDPSPPMIPILYD